MKIKEQSNFRYLILSYDLKNAEFIVASFSSNFKQQFLAEFKIRLDGWISNMDFSEHHGQILKKSFKLKWFLKEIFDGAGEQMPVVEHHGGKRDVEVGKKWRAQCNGHMGAQWGESGKRESGEDVGEQISG